MILDTIFAYGHKNVICSHKSTIEVTKDDYLTPKGNCILGIKSNKSCTNLSENLKRYLLLGRELEIIIKIDDLSDNFYGSGSRELTLSNNSDIVFRKSNFICDRTVLINCTKSSSELNRNLIEKIQKSKNKFKIEFIADI
ncbi:MAG: DUF371 domain-containing protein [Candidatus Lokiarchaeota archaeon]|nr:DUF371 domain-containing protein [Candidatus Lokiarchaeota archaeon]MBD3198711.1 DUF371 domain-containing protein [Candidatus Lokiarchaeota archaeon]